MKTTEWNIFPITKGKLASFIFTTIPCLFFNINEFFFVDEEIRPEPRVTSAKVWKRTLQFLLYIWCCYCGTSRQIFKINPFNLYVCGRVIASLWGLVLWSASSALFPLLPRKVVNDARRETILSGLSVKLRRRLYAIKEASKRARGSFVIVL